MQRLKDKAALEDKILAQRDELLKKFSDSTELIKVKEFEGRRGRLRNIVNSLKEQLAKQEEQPRNPRTN